MKFRAHGDLSARSINNILFIEGTGPWNIEKLKYMEVAAKDMLAKLYQQPWAVLCIMHGEIAFLPDAAAMLTEVIRQDKHKNRVATAIVITNSNLVCFSKGHLSKIYNDAGETFEFFDDRESAMSWLSAEIAEYKKPR